MSLVGNFETKEIPAIVSFGTVLVEDRQESERQGMYVGKEVHYAYLTAVGSKDRVPLKAAQFFTNLEQDLKNERIPREWVERYKKQYSEWQQGRELPPDGTPIRGWPVVSPLQQEKLISLHVMTVEMLANCNDEVRTRMGMGAVELQNKARNWLQQVKDVGPNVQKIANLERENQTLRETQESLVARLNELEARMQSGAGPVHPAQVSVSDGLQVDDILPDMEPLARAGRKK